MRYVVDAAPGGDSYQWRLHASNGRKLATSPDWFYSQSKARTAASRFKLRCSSWNYEVYGNFQGIYRWRAKSEDNQVVALCVGSFSSQFDARVAARSVQENGGGASGP
jgi:uncharacterized protein YegP (UPF0339 family)